MLNKKLVIAALLAVSTNVMSEVSAVSKEEPKKEVKKEEPKKEVKKEEPKKEVKKEEPKKEEVKPLPEDPKLRPAWQTGTGDPTQDSLKKDGTYTLCDQGNTAMWKAAEDKYTKLAAAEKKATTDLEEAKKEYDKLDKLVQDAVKAQKKHTDDNKAFLEAADKTIAKHAELLKTGTQALVTSAKETTAKALAKYKAAADGKVAGALKDTQDAEGEVTKQRVRLESLLTLKQNNVTEELAWATRIAALKTASETADAQVVTDTTDLAEKIAIGESRSYLYNTMQLVNTAVYHPKCDALKNCLYSEKSNTKSKSVWEWTNTTDACTKQKDASNNNADIKCTILGLDGKDKQGTVIGLKKQFADWLGSDSANPKTGQYKVLADADYTAGSPSKLKDATDKYKSWQALVMTAQALNTGCWKVAGSNSGSFQASDWYSYCGKTKSDASANPACATDLKDTPQTACYAYNPLISKSAASSVTDGYKNSQEDILGAATTEKGTFGAGTSGDKNLTTFYDSSKKDLTEIKAKAQINLWLRNWSNTQLLVVNSSNISANGDYPNKGNIAANTWALTGIGKAEDLLKVDTEKKTKAKGDWDFAIKQQQDQGKDDAALDLDITNARALLGDLVKEVAVKARLEHTTKKAWEDAVKAQAATQADYDALGTAKNGNNAATGSYAEFDAACDIAGVTSGTNKNSCSAIGKIILQNDFHQARVDWATENREPARLKWVAATEALNGVPQKHASGPNAGKVIQINGADQLKGGAKAMAAAAKTAMENAKEACKVAAFGIAQKAREDADALTKAQAAKRTKMVEKYTALSKFPTDGSRGTLCNLPKGNPDGDRVKECKEEEGGQALCCGAAQRFLKNGTKLTIETCQLAIAATYTYYPPLEDNDVEQPIPETWRFQCISGAQKLAAVAAAVLATGAMIA